jgi:hypothetical protein
MIWFVTFCGNALTGQISREDLRLSFAALWLQTVEIASISLGVPDVVLHASAAWMRVGCDHVVSTALRLMQDLTSC